MAGLVSRVAGSYRRHFADPRRERLFISSVSFFCTFATVRAITHAIRAQRGPFRNLSVGGKHLHHLVPGILGLLSVGYLWLAGIGTESATRRASSRATSALYGIGSALTLDEFALWLNLEDVYWAKQGRESLDAVVLFGALLSVGLWGHPFFRAMGRDLLGIERLTPSARISRPEAGRRRVAAWGISLRSHADTAGSRPKSERMRAVP